MKAIIALFAVVSAFVVLPHGAVAQESGDGSAPVVASESAAGAEQSGAAPAQDLAPVAGGAADEGDERAPVEIVPGDAEAKGCFIIWCWGDYDKK